MLHINGIEVVFDEQARSNEIKLPAASTEEWAKDDIIWWDTANDYCSKLATVTPTALNAIVGIASSEKLEGEEKGGVSVKCRIRAKVTSATANNEPGKAVIPAVSSGVYTFAVGTAGACGNLCDHITINTFGQIEIDTKAMGQFWEASTAAT